MTYALTGLIDRWGWRIQYERDAPLDKSGLKQIYADTLATGNLHAAEDFSWWRKYFPHQNLNAYAGFGWLFYNSNYFARPDNTGRALFWYVAHVEFDLYQNKLLLFGDTNFFTDRELSNKLKPTELDWIIGLAFRFRDNYELSVYREQDLSVDKPGSLSTILGSPIAVLIRCAQTVLDEIRRSIVFYAHSRLVILWWSDLTST